MDKYKITIEFEYNTDFKGQLLRPILPIKEGISIDKEGISIEEKLRVTYPKEGIITVTIS